MAKKESRFDVLSILIGVLLSLIAQGIYDAIFYWATGKILDEVVVIIITYMLVTLSVVLLLAWLVYRIWKKSQRNVYDERGKIMNGNEKKEPWKAKQDDIIPNELEDARKFLLKSYHSYVQTHAGYIIAIMLGFFALISGFDTFSKIYGGTIFFIILMIALVKLGAFMILRITYWTCYTNYATNLTLKDVIYFFNEFNSPKKYPFWKNLQL